MFLEDEVNLLTQKLTVYEQEVTELRGKGGAGGSIIRRQEEGEV